MEALKVATVKGPDRSQEAELSDGNGYHKPRIRLAPRIKSALTALLEAIDYGQDLERTAWDFAIELSCLRRMKLSNSDLRWLVGRELVDQTGFEDIASSRVHRPRALWVNLPQGDFRGPWWTATRSATFVNATPLHAIYRALTKRTSRNEPFAVAGLTPRSSRLLRSNSSSSAVNTAFVHPKPVSFER